jgi:argininosuccinate synthase
MIEENKWLGHITNNSGGEMKKALLAYSGGLDTSAILVWLQKEMNLEVYCYCCDMGNMPDKEWLEKRALSFGAKKFIFDDAREEFVNDYVFNVIKSGALYEGEYLLGTAIGRPLIASKMGKVAEEYDIDIFVHGATGKGNDQLRLEQSWSYLYPDKEILTPWKEWSFKGRNELLNYLEAQGYPYEGESGGRYSIDENIFHKSTEGAELEDVAISYNDEILDHKIEETMPSKITLSFKKGIPFALNGEEYGAKDLLDELNKYGIQYNIGIADIVEERVNGIKSRGVYHTPGGTVLAFALKKLKEICWSHKTTKLAQMMSIEYAELVYEGAWFSTARTSLDAFFNSAAQNLEGTVSLEFGPSFMKVLSRKSEKSLYSKSLVSFEEDEFGINKSAVGFCKTRNLQYINEGKVK